MKPMRTFARPAGRFRRRLKAPRHRKRHRIAGDTCLLLVYRLPSAAQNDSDRARWRLASTTSILTPWACRRDDASRRSCSANSPILIQLEGGLVVLGQRRILLLLAEDA